jgi:hypothetical protein
MAASGQKPAQSILGSVDTGQVSLMITQAQKEALRKKGFSDEQISNMTPESAHQVLGVLPAAPY